MNRALLESMIRICKTYWVALVAFLVVGICQISIGLYAIVLLQHLLDSIPDAQQLSDLTPPLLMYGGFTLVNHLLIYLEGYPRSILYNGSYNWAKVRALKKVSTISYLAYQDLGTGQLIERVEQGASATQGILNGLYLALLRYFVPQITIALLLVRHYNRALFAIFLGLVLVLSVASSLLMRALRRHVDQMLVHQERFAKFSVRGFMELVVFRVNNRFGREIERVTQISDDIVRARAKIRLVQELLFTGFAALTFSITVGVIVQQAGLIIAGVSTIGSLVALTSLIQQVVSPISHFSVALTQYQHDRVAFGRFSEFLALPEDVGLKARLDPAIHNGTMRVRDVSFSYRDHEVLRNLSLTLAGGRTTALVGVSGAGKSTLVKLLLGLLKPQSGQILIDEQDLAAISLSAYYRQVAYIPQDPPVFDGTIRENMIFDEEVGEAVLRAAIATAGLASLIARLPDGLGTVVGERGTKLSGGERQRLAFARLLIQQPKIVVMDEPTSSLDSLTEAAVTNGLTDFLTGRTVVVIAHRLQTVKSADRIVVLDTGRIVQDGNFASLVEAEGPFREMWEIQSG